MKTTRKGVFETNSSSTHAMAIVPDEEYKKMKADHSLWYHPKYGLKTKEEASKLIPEEDRKYLTDEEDGGSWPLYDNGWFNYEEWHSDLEQDEHEYTSAHGDKIHIICAYGYD